MSKAVRHGKASQGRWSDPGRCHEQTGRFRSLQPKARGILKDVPWRSQNEGQVLPDQSGSSTCHHWFFTFPTRSQMPKTSGGLHGDHLHLRQRAQHLVAVLKGRHLLVARRRCGNRGFFVCRLTEKWSVVKVDFVLFYPWQWWCPKSWKCPCWIDVPLVRTSGQDGRSGSPLEILQIHKSVRCCGNGVFSDQLDPKYPSQWSNFRWAHIVPWCRGDIQWICAEYLVILWVFSTIRTKVVAGWYPPLESLVL